MSIINGGDFEELAFNDTELGTGFFKPMKDQDNTLIPGGYENQDDGAVTGDGTLVVTKNRNVGSLTIVVANDMTAGTSDIEVAKILQSSLREQVWTVAHSNGSVYRGIGVIVGPLEGNTNKSTFQLKINSGLGFEQQ